MSKKPPARQSAIHQLVELANELLAYTEKMERGGYQQRLQAQAIHREISQMMQHENEWMIWQMAEVSLVPKMMRLAKDINLYQNLQAKNFTVRNKSKRYDKEESHGSSAYDPYLRKSSSHPPLSENEQTRVNQLIAELNQQLIDEN